MHFAPTETELSLLDDATPDECLNYFLTRIMEVEEVWGLNNGHGWAIKTENDKTVLPIWPYLDLAKAYALNDWEKNTPDAISLEHFVYNLLPTLIAQGIHIEIMPRSTQQGILVKADALFEIIERKMDTGEYFLEG